MLNPLGSSQIYMRIYFLIWLIGGVLHYLLLRFALDINHFGALLDAAVFNVSFAIIGYGIWYVVRFSGIEPGSIFDAIITHLLAAMILSAIWVGTGYMVLKMIPGTGSGYLLFVKETIYWRGALGIIYYILIALNYYLVIFYTEYQQQKLRKSEMDRLLKESELSMLKAQINPHFIFNSLNSISSLILTNSEKAHEMVVNLSSFLRYTITPRDKKLVKLSQELKAIDLYLSIEKIRFGDKLDVSISCEKSLDNQLLPNMILQPLVENAVKYGVYESTDTCEINITCHSVQNAMIINILNDIEPGGIPKKGKGIGLQNVRSRLKMIYEQDNLLTIEKSDVRFSVKLIIPQ